MSTDHGFAVAGTENRSREERGRGGQSWREAGQDKRTRQGGHVKSISAQGFLRHVVFHACVSASGMVWIPLGIWQHRYDGVRRSSRIRVPRRG